MPANIRAANCCSSIPKTQTFKEFPLPGPDPSPYALGFDADGFLWYDSHNMDVIGRFDNKDGQGDRVSLSAFGDRHAGIFPRFTRPHVVWLVAEQ